MLYRMSFHVGPVSKSQGEQLARPLRDIGCDPLVGTETIYFTIWGEDAIGANVTARAMLRDFFPKCAFDVRVMFPVRSHHDKAVS